MGKCLLKKLTRERLWRRARPSSPAPRTRTEEMGDMCAFDCLGFSATQSVWVHRVCK